MSLKFIIPTLVAMVPLSGQGAEQNARFPIPTVTERHPSSRSPLNSGKFD
jgi:hypothetical protein